MTNQVVDQKQYFNNRMTHRMPDGYYIDDNGNKLYQSMYKVINGKICLKIIKEVLEERGLWQEGLRVKEAQKLLGSQPDFSSTRSAIEDVHSYQGWPYRRTLSKVPL
ncbi:hypothetical protein BDB00DRAFT_894981 [Zychaea mexicana]|uniref:uncharacterized protein n=1 Tax=Zychaea mexicana TaxID=64656 RepID=UPI0022FE5AC7|nr:uncharacterized protein BDB00DRAFT_894981 [Zychaea mexicana]KAI9496182.1 hypothetical protein BDB00DRAFT_894981 [Zychaea mexicana]